MMLVYLLTTIIVGSWLLKMINRKSFIVNRTPLDIPLLLFLGANILSTIFSIDPHTSIWGYYSRSNGGLLSLISYLLLYWGLVSNINKDQVLKLLKIGLVGGVIISIWGIFEHFGVSLSCVVLRQELNASCWVQDVTARVFATLGQPNWLAAYLAMLIFPAMYFAVTEKRTIPYTLYPILLYLAFTFTYSRGAALGLLAGLAVFIIVSFYFKMLSLRSSMTFILASFIIINLLFGSALTNFKLLSKFAPPPRPSLVTSPSGTQLENGGTESGQIRLIVWKGAWEVFKHYPILGSGVETFAYSYYQYRPAEHNLTSEWDFLYNKAHNEYLNYLATTGLVGFITYLSIIVFFVWWCIKYVIVIPSKARNLKINLEISHNVRDDRLLVMALLASYISYLIQNFFGFSVVIIALFFFLFPAMAFVFTDSIKGYRLQAFGSEAQARRVTGFSWIYRRPLYTKATKTFVILIIIYLLYSIINLWRADILFAQGKRHNETGNPGRAYNSLSDAVKKNPGEPFYRSELGNAAASSSIALSDSDATLSGQLKDRALYETDLALNTSPHNLSYLRTAVRTYFELSTIDQSLVQKSLDALDKSIKLAPTDPKLLYNKSLILGEVGKKGEAIEALQKAIQLKPNYQEALQKLGELNK